MQTRKQQFRDERTTFLVIELEHAYRGPHAGVTALVSVAGRDKPLTRTWHAPDGYLERQAKTDLEMWLSLVAQQALLRWTGPSPDSPGK